MTPVTIFLELSWPLIATVAVVLLLAAVGLVSIGVLLVRALARLRR